LTRPVPRILVLGDRPLVGLAAVRSLGRAGYPVGVAGGAGATVPQASRWSRKAHALPPIATSDDWSERLRSVIREAGYDAVVASSDAELARLVADPVDVPTVPALRPAHGPLLDKLELAQLAGTVGVGYPRTWSADADHEPEAAPRDPEGVIVKSARTASWASGRLAILPGAILARDDAARQAAVASIRERGGQPILQERLTGRKLQVMIIRRAGGTGFRFACDVRRELPPVHGAEAMLQRLTTGSGVGRDAVAALERLADGVGYEGFVGAELLLTAEGRLHVVDVNPRLGGAIGFPELLGLRPIERAVRDALGMTPLAPPVGGESQRYHHLVRELRRLIARPQSLLEVFGSISPSDVWDVPAARDARPELRRLRLRLRPVGARA
jgi:hypothetical protein